MIFVSSAPRGEPDLTWRKKCHGTSRQLQYPMGTAPQLEEDLRRRDGRARTWPQSSRTECPFPSQDHLKNQRLLSPRFDSRLQYDTVPTMKKIGTAAFLRGVRSIFLSDCKGM